MHRNNTQNTSFGKLRWVKPIKISVGRELCACSQWGRTPNREPPLPALRNRPQRPEKTNLRPFCLP